MQVWFNVFLPLIYPFHPFVSHSVFKLGSLSHPFILTLLMSKPSNLQSFIFISSVGVFLFPFDLITNMVVHTSVTVLLILIALHPLPLIFPFWIFCVLLFLRACCYVLSQSLHCHCTGTALPWPAGLSPGPWTLMPSGARSPVSPPQPAPGAPSRGAVAPVGDRRPGWQRVSLSRVLKAVSRLGWLLPPPFLSRLCYWCEWQRNVAISES